MGGVMKVSIAYNKHNVSVCSYNIDSWSSLTPHTDVLISVG
jgi:hypothetical protein